MGKGWEIRTAVILAESSSPIHRSHAITLCKSWKYEVKEHVLVLNGSGIFHDCYILQSQE